MGAFEKYVDDVTSGGSILQKFQKLFEIKKFKVEGDKKLVRLGVIPKKKKKLGAGIFSPSPHLPPW